MKKLRIASLAAALPLLLLTACGAADTSLVLTSNWYFNTNTTSPVGAREDLEYNVAFELYPENEDADFRAEYSEGVYKSSLRGENISYAEGNPVGYYLHTEFSIKGKFFFNGEYGEEFTDTVSSEVWFLNVTEGLRPIRSVKRVKCHAPTVSAPLTGVVSDYTYTAVYSADLTSTDITYEDASGKTESSVKLKGKGSFIDNEQILFMLRGLNLENAFTFRTVNPVQGTEATVESGTIESQERTETFAINGETAERTFSVFKTPISYTGTYRGETQTLYYAKRTDVNANLYRNMLVRAEVPSLESLGNFVYTLRSATFDS